MRQRILFRQLADRDRRRRAGAVVGDIAIAVRGAANRAGTRGNRIGHRHHDELAGCAAHLDRREHWRGGGDGRAAQRPGEQRRGEQRTGFTDYALIRGFFYHALIGR
jgi:hypothetical protein